MWRLVREDRSLRFWRVLIDAPPTRRRRCNLSTFSVTPCTADYGTAVRAVAGRGLGTGYCDNSLTYTPPRNRTRCARRVLLRRPVVEPLQLCHKLLPASRSDTDLCSNCLVLPSARSVLRTSLADNNTSIGCIDLTFLVHRLKARNYRCHDER